MTTLVVILIAAGLAAVVAGVVRMALALAARRAEKR